MRALTEALVMMRHEWSETVSKKIRLSYFESMNDLVWIG